MPPAFQVTLSFDPFGVNANLHVGPGMAVAGGRHASEVPVVGQPQRLVRHDARGRQRRNQRADRGEAERSAHPRLNLVDGSRVDAAGAFASGMVVLLGSRGGLNGYEPINFGIDGSSLGVTGIILLMMFVALFISVLRYNNFTRPQADRELDDVHEAARHEHEAQHEYDVPH